MHSEKLRRIKELKKLIDHRKSRDEVWEEAMRQYVGLILEISHDLDRLSPKL